ncbi:aspartic proteinase Asp1-like [Brassica napus]|uniref:aspartic proteinase Asp1-like n=1 Tax=Brassica napus TaxID=3708 RepID=UPI002078FEF5|nr:aspartic proteinase Asp1-like [Brassica napus]
MRYWTAELLFNDKTTGVKGINFIFDSGSSYTYFNAEAYQTILDLIRKDLKGKPLKDTKEDKSLPVCWKDMKPLKSVHDVKKYFKTITLRFGSQKNGQLFQIPPESYLIITVSLTYDLYISIKIHGRESLRLRVCVFFLFQEKETCVWGF